MLSREQLWLGGCVIIAYWLTYEWGKIMRRVVSALVVALFVVVGVVGAAPARASAACTLVAPARVTVWHYYTGVPLRASGACTWGTGWGAWDLYHPTQGWQDTTLFDGSTRDTWDYYTFDSMGRMTWRPAGAWDSNYNTLSQNTVATEVRLGSAARLSAARSGVYVTVSMQGTRYWPAGDRSVAFTSAHGSIQYRVPGTSTWHWLRGIVTNSHGTASYRYVSRTPRDYRVVLNGTPAIWNATSSTVRK